MKGMLKWAGGKGRVAEQIGEVFPENCGGTYHEPFLGAGALFFHLKAQGRVGAAVLSDVNLQLINFWRSIQKHPEVVIAELKPMRGFGTGWKESYAQFRAEYNEALLNKNEGPAQAARFLWLNRACFNGLYRVNRKGTFNVPPGSYKTVKLPEPLMILRYSKMLQDALIQVRDFQASARLVGDGDWVFCDPPYVDRRTKAKSFTAFTSGGFTMADQVALADSCQSDHGFGQAECVVATNHDTPEVREMYGPPRFEVAGGYALSRSISAGDRENAGELILRNYSPVVDMAQGHA